MTGPILAAILVAVWLPLALAFAWWATGRNSYQVRTKLEMTRKQKFARAHGLLVVVIMALAGATTVLYGFKEARYASLLAAAGLMLFSGFVSLVIGTLFLPETEINNAGLLQHTREKHVLVNKHGFAGAIWRILGRGGKD